MKKFRLAISIILLFSTTLNWYAPILFKPSIAFLSLEGFTTLMIGVYILLPKTLFESRNINRDKIDWAVTFLLLVICTYTVYQAKTASNDFWSTENLDSSIEQISKDSGVQLSMNPENKESFLKQIKQPLFQYLNIGVCLLYLGFTLFAFYDWRNQKTIK